MPRRVEFKGWVTDYKQYLYQGLTDTEVSNLINDLHKMVPDTLTDYIDWEQTRNERGTWPTQLMVRLWFSIEATLLTRIGLPDVMREELKQGLYNQKGQVVSSRLELRPKRKPSAKAHALFFEGLEEVKGTSPRFALSMAGFRSVSSWEAQLLQNTLKEKVLQEKDGLSSRLQESAQNSVNPFRGRGQLGLTNGSGSQPFS